MARLSFAELPMVKPYSILDAQSEELHRGHKAEDIRARNHLRHALRTEFRTLQLLLRDVNLAMQSKVERLAMETAL